MNTRKMFVNRLPIVQWDIEEHLGGRSGVGAGPATQTCASLNDTITIMADIIGRGGKVTVIGRNRIGAGRFYTLGLITN